MMMYLLEEAMLKAIKLKQRLLMLMQKVAILKLLEIMRIQKVLTQQLVE
jgi:hypothetical protein